MDTRTDYLVLAGNPERAIALDARALLTDGRTTIPVGAEELGGGTFLVVIREQKNGKPGDIVHWQPFRVATLAEVEERLLPPQAATRFELDVRPWVLRADSPSLGELPRSQSRSTAWWSLVFEDSTVDLDLDGKSAGVPGVTIVTSSPWAAGDGDDSTSLKERFSDLGLTGLQGHEVRFESLEWVEQADREIEVDEGLRLALRHYYFAVTMHTQASVQPISATNIGKARKKRFFAHETSADLRPPNHPVFWASYAVRDFGRDTGLLNQLGKQVKAGNFPSGLGKVDTTNGDGGAATFETGMYLQLSPWLPGEDEGVVQKGIVAVDVVASRPGIGIPKTRGAAGKTALGKMLSKMLTGPSNKANTLDLGAPPEGYTISETVAAVQTVPGNLPLLDDPVMRFLDEDQPFDVYSPLFPVDTKRSEATEKTRLDEFPETALVSLGAKLQAGSLIRMDAVVANARRPKAMIPVDAYAQWIVKVTVAMGIDDQVFVSDEAIIVSDEDLQPEISVVPPKPGVLDRLSALLGLGKGMMVFLIVLVVVIVLAGGIPGIITAIGGLSRSSRRTSQSG